MKRSRVDMIWGLLLIVLGALFMGQTLGWIPELTAVLWSGLFGGASVLFFITYFARGREAWGLLFPAFITAAIAAIILLAVSGFDGAILGSLVLWAISIPFWVVYAANRQQNWWALIPGWIMAVIGFIVMLADVVPGEWIGALVLFAIGLPFFVVFLSNREYWWALIPGFVLSVLGLVVLLSTSASGEFVGFLVMIAIAMPFFVIYFRYEQHWWALIPAGILSSIGVVALLAGLFPNESGIYGRMLGTVLFLGWAATFGLLWMARKRHNTDWAKYPAGVLAAIGLLVLVLGEALNNLWALALIGAGIWLLIDNYRRPGLKGN